MKSAAQIVVLAGTNGAGKSSIIGDYLRERGSEYYNPDQITRRLEEQFPGLSRDQANARAWRWGRRQLESAITDRRTFAFETTLGGRTMTALLLKASNVGMRVRVWYVGLDSVERHLRRVRARVAAGGHDIAAERIRERYDASRQNLIRLLPHLSELRVFDNSLEADPAQGRTPHPQLVLHVRQGLVIDMCPPDSTPAWAKPIIAAQLRIMPPDR